MTSAAIYARVSSARQKKDETIGSQTAALREHAAQARLDVPEEWVFEDEGHSGATLVRPALEALRDLAAQGCLDVVLCYSPDRLARKFAYQALLLEEFARAGVRVEFVKGPRGDTPEDQLLIQFQGIFAEYEKAQLAERYRRGKAHRARTGSVNVLSGAPFGYRYVRKTDLCGAAYEVIEHEAVLVAEMFRRYADDGAAIADLARWLTDQGAATRTGKHRWDRSVIWAMLRNPAYAGTAVFGKTMAVHEPPGLNRVARLQGRSVPRAVKTVDRPRDQWLEIAVPAIVTAESFARVQQRLEGNKRFAARNTKVPSLLQGLAACSACGYGYYRTSARTTSRKIYYYRCLGSDDYRYEGGRVCGNKPVRADYLDDRRVGSHHRPARRPGPDPRRDHQAARAGPHRRPGDPAAQAARAGTGQGHRLGHRHDRGVLRAADHDRRAARADAAPARPRDQPAQPDRRRRRPDRRPGRLPRPRRRPGRLPRPAARQRRHRHRRRTPARPAAAHQGHPHRPRENHHPAPHSHPRGRLRRPAA